MLKGMSAKDGREEEKEKVKKKKNGIKMVC